jgi:L-fuculose-phosphate aldolase
MSARVPAFQRQRRAIVDACRNLTPLGINQGKSGNISLRVKGGFLISPSGIAYDRLTPSDVVFMRVDGSVPGKQRAPSSEWRFHRDIFATRADANAVVHTHAMFATTLACLHRDIPAFHYMVAKAGGDSIRCAPYATFGTQKLSDHALKALEGRKACLLANHGMIVLGATLDDALLLAIEVEALAAQYWRALQLGKPKLLSAAEMRRVVKKFETYGKQP